MTAAVMRTPLGDDWLKQERLAEEGGGCGRDPTRVVTWLNLTTGEVQDEHPHQKFVRQNAETQTRRAQADYQAKWNAIEEYRVTCRAGIEARTGRLLEERREVAVG